MDSILLSIIIVYGLVIGSFLNVVIYRLPRGESLAFPRSHCPNCNTTLKVRDLLPLISYWSCAGKCRYCQKKISPIYPLIESVNAFLYFLVYIVYDFSIVSITYMLAASVLLVIFMVDLQNYKILNSLNICLFLLGVFLIVIGKNSLVLALIGAVAGVGFIGLIMLIAKLMSKSSFGYGDLKFIFAAGFLLTFPQILTAFVFTSISSAIVIVYLLIQKKINCGSILPFGTFLSLGTFIAIIFPNFLSLF